MRRALLPLNVRGYVAMVLGACAFFLSCLLRTTRSEGDIDTVEVTADRLHVLPTEAIDSVFGFGKNALETPRASPPSAPRCWTR